jgi:hypothetical protein
VPGFIRWVEEMDSWVSRSLGPSDGSAAGTIRTFPDEISALQWLAARFTGANFPQRKAASYSFLNSKTKF